MSVSPNDTRDELSLDSEDEGDYLDDPEGSGDYSTRMETLLDDSHELEDEQDEQEEFLYEGDDAEVSAAGYRDQLRQVLEAEDSEESVLGKDDGEEMSFDLLRFDHPSSLPSTPPSRVVSPGLGSHLKRPFLHPTVSRLRSFTPQASPSASVGTVSHKLDDSPSGSHFSAMSRSSSLSNLHAAANGGTIPEEPQREVFRWTQLRTMGTHVYAKRQTKASSVLGSPNAGAPMVMAANGMICVGTDAGRIMVYDFKQTLKCICGNDNPVKPIGPVTALALSHDHTYVASGHASGHIQLFDLSNPQTPARAVLPTTLTAVQSGRQEGHLQSSRIVSIGFVGGRHTAVVTADEHGLAFYHSLGKVLFVEASDILRILGKYPDEPVEKPLLPSQVVAPRKRNSRFTILGMAPLPLGTCPHPTDTYNVVALLTPAKLVIVGLKPSPKTWFKRPRTGDEQVASKARSKWKGTLAWFPSVVPGTAPILVYSWGSALHLMRVNEARTRTATKNPRTGKISEVDVGSIVFEEVGSYKSEENILAVQWLNVNQIVVFTAKTLEVFDVRSGAVKLVDSAPFDALSLISPSLGYTFNGSIAYVDSVGDIAHSVRVYKGKIFLLGRQELRVGTLLTWADRILSSVQDGDFLAAIELTRSYYTGEAPGNRNGLPEDTAERKQVIGQKMEELMHASTRYAFSEDRMTDETHVSSDGRGVDRTELFEGLVTTCARACTALDDFEFLFEDLFTQYEDNGIARMYLMRLEPFIIDGNIKYVPPRITQRLVRMHEENGRPDLAERVIWHIDPACLDLNQAIGLCQKHHLYDALIYVYTRAMHDYVAPAVELIGLIRKVQQYRTSRQEAMESGSHEGIELEDDAMEPTILNAYKIYPYLANALSGLTYPSEEPLDEDEAFQAKKDLYTFLFSGRSSVWPLGDGGGLVLTSDEEGGVEPTYPYARLLLKFDAESLLHSMDIAFEDAYLNDESQGVSRLVIVKILLEILSSGNLPSTHITFVNIFVARNVPKYPQFIQIAPTALHNILIGLAEDPDESTREDRQLAAEYLLSVYNPHESERILSIFEEAGFFRILRSWHRHDRRWVPLLETYLQDPSMRSLEIFDHVEEVLTTSSRANKGIVSLEMLSTITDALPQLLNAKIANTALLVDKHTPDLHEDALDAMGEDADEDRFEYLRYLLGPPHPEDEEYITPTRPPPPSLKVAPELRQLYVSLQCRYHPDDVIEALKFLPADMLDWTAVALACEENEVYDAAVWVADYRGDPRAALSKADGFQKELTIRVVETLAEGGLHGEKEIAALERMGRTGVTICMERSQGLSPSEVSLEDIWFQLLSNQIDCVQKVSACCSPEAQTGSDALEGSTRVEWQTLSRLRSLVQETFGALVSTSSTKGISFPQLFKRLVDPAAHAQAAAGTPYTEFRTILTGMLESYRSDGDILVITKHLVDRDLFDTVEYVVKERAKGWTPSRGICSYCRKPLASSHEPLAEGVQIVVSRTGSIYHSTCRPLA